MDFPRKYDTETDGFPEWGHRVEILLDGVVQTGVSAYDCDEGVIRRAKTKVNGVHIMEHGKTVWEYLRGEVTVRQKLTKE